MPLTDLFARLRLRGQLIAATTAACTVPLLLLSLFGGMNAQDSLRNQAFNQLESIREIKKNQIEDYFTQIRNQVITYSEDRMIIGAMKGFKTAFRELPYETSVSESQVDGFRSSIADYYQNQFGREFSNQNGAEITTGDLVPSNRASVIAQYRYISNNPNPLGGKDGLDAAADGSLYSRIHDQYHPIIRNFLKKFEYYDIFLVDPVTGDIIYSVFKEIDYATSLKTGPYRGTNFARVFEQALKLGPGDSAALVDFEPYLPSYNGAASFIASPIFDGNTLEGILVFQMPVGRIDSIMQERSGLGESGETYLVGSDKLMRSQSRFSKETSILTTTVDTDASTAVLAGKVGAEVVDDYRGVPVLSAYSPLEIEGLEWSILAEIDESEALAPTGALIQRFILWSVVGLLIAALTAYLVARSILRKLGADPLHLNDVVNAIANDDLSMDLGDEADADGVFAGMVKMQQNLRRSIQADRAALAESTRIRHALDNANTAIMVAGPTGEIIFINGAMQTLFAQSSSDLRNHLPTLDPKNLVGTNISTLHRNASDPFQRVHETKETLSCDVKMGSKTFSIVATPISFEGERLGVALEWADRTQELAIQGEVEAIVNAATSGNLSERLDVRDKDGFFLTLSTGVNELVEVSEGVINDTVRVLGAVAHGDLDQTIEREYEGAFAQLKHDANTTVERLKEVVGKIKDTAGSVKIGADEIAQGNSNLSHRTEQQANNLQTTAASMEEMTATVKQNATNASQANDVAINAHDHAQRGSDVVAQAVHAMNEISAASKKISDIIGVIDEIAFQTNLLALNASVEAARAGEQGRGFAVVASEVRNLAGRSATAAKEIKELIEDSVSKIDEGARFVTQSGDSLGEIVSGIKQVTEIVGEIAAASQEQATGIGDVNDSIVQLDELTQQNAALVEEAAAASESLGEQARNLDELIGFFRVEAQSIQAHSEPSVDRRSADRPWSSNQQNAAKESVGTTAPVKVAANGDASGDQWEEF